MKRLGIALIILGALLGALSIASMVSSFANIFATLGGDSTTSSGGMDISYVQILVGGGLAFVLVSCGLYMIRRAAGTEETGGCGLFGLKSKCPKCGRKSFIKPEICKCGYGAESEEARRSLPNWTESRGCLS